MPDNRRQSQVPWEPWADATEIEPGIWRLSRSSTATAYATIRFIRKGGELGYRVDGRDRQLIGYFIRLRAAIRAAWESQAHE